MLEVVHLSHQCGLSGGEATRTLEEVTFALPAGHLLMLIGPPTSGCGLLLQVLAGLQQPLRGAVRFWGKDGALEAPHPNLIAYVQPQDMGLIPELTVRESLMSAHFLRVAEAEREARISAVSHLLVVVGLETVASQRVALLSLAQKRRLRLALALVSQPRLLLCDSLLEGLDAKSAQEVLALLRLVQADLAGRSIVLSSRTAAHASEGDSALILLEGRVAFHGPAKALPHYFSISQLDELFTRLTKRPSERWAESWSRHRESYYQAFKLGKIESEPLVPPRSETDESLTPTEALISEEETRLLKEEGNPDPESLTPPTPLPLPGLWDQVKHLTLRRWTLFRRTQSQWVEQFVLLVTCPLLATLLILPNHSFLSAAHVGETAPATLWPAGYTASMLLWVQVLLILLITVRLTAKELAAERFLHAREHEGGLSHSAYLLSKLSFFFPLLICQSAALLLFLELTGGHLPGSGTMRLILLVLTSFAFASISLGISAHAPNADRASSRVWLLWAVNALLAGAMLGLPRPIGALLQPFVTAYYGWSGCADTLAGTSLFPAMTTFVRTWFATPKTAILALSLHVLIGLALAYWGLKRRSSGRMTS